MTHAARAHLRACLAGLLGLLPAACAGTPPSPTTTPPPTPQKCELHGDVMLEDDVPLVFGLLDDRNEVSLPVVFVLPDDRNEVPLPVDLAAAAPNARLFAHGGCNAPVPARATVRLFFCPTCREVCRQHGYPRWR